MDVPANHEKTIDGKKGIAGENIGLLLGILSFLGYLGILLYVMLALALFLIYANPKSHWYRL